MDKKTKIKFNILAVIMIMIFCFALTPKTLQNDTYYTIKIGQHIEQKGIDMKDPFSWHKDLPYTYPHWAYDLATYEVFQLGENVGIGGFTAIYVMTVILAMILGVTLYVASNKICKNELIAFIVTLGVLYLLKSFIAARAQLVTYILFVLQILFIEQFLKAKKKRYAVGLIIIPIIIANVHLAVWPFYFVLFLPYVAEYIIALLADSNIYYRLSIAMKNGKLKRLEKKENQKEKIEKVQKELNTLKEKEQESIEKREKRRNNPYKIIIKKNSNVKWLIVIMIICAFTGLLTPLGDTPYTYLIKTMQGNTMDSISEHLPLTLINNTNMIVVLIMFLALLICTDTKITLRDFFMLAGLILLSFMSRRQISMFVLVCGFIFQRMVGSFVQKYDKEGCNAVSTAMTTIVGKILTILLIVLISFYFYRGKINAKIIDESSYPVAACDYIIENLDLSKIKLFNEYNYGSYLLYRGIPVFIDSRADLYAPEFNGTKNENGKYQGRDIFSDYINTSNISTYYDDKFKQYEITHVILKKNTKLNMLIMRDVKYKEIYSDKNFVIYERLEV